VSSLRFKTTGNAGALEADVLVTVGLAEFARLRDDKTVEI
jgi:hypothetical protein